MVFCCLILAVILVLVNAQVSNLPPPDYSKDPFPPFPDPGISDPSIKNVFGTRLYGWKGCGQDEEERISQAFVDMQHIAAYKGNSGTIDWTAQSVIDFFGPTTGPHSLGQDTKDEIHKIFVQLQQMYAVVPSPPFRGISNWIEVRCSGGDNTGDPTNVCGDRPPEDPNAPKCPDGSTPIPPPGKKPKSDMQAWTDNNQPGAWDTITFCNEFFALPTYQQALTKNNGLGSSGRYNLENWDSQARCFLHEATHLDYFMNANSTVPYVQDLKFKAIIDKKSGEFLAYGVRYSKVLAKYESDDPATPGGYYTQRNADNFAWFALANLAGNIMSHYPNFPIVRTKPLKVPTGLDGEPPWLTFSIDSDGALDLIGNLTDASEAGGDQCQDYSRPAAPTANGEVTINSIYTDSDYTGANKEQEYAWDAASYGGVVTNTALRILPLGDGITSGALSSDGNGYRNQLYSSLASGVNTVDFVGTLQIGTMGDNDNGGYVGATIDQIQNQAASPLKDPPNVILLHAGTVDMQKSNDVGNAATRLGKLIDSQLANYPDALILVAQIIPSLDAGTNANIAIFNAAIPDMVASRTAAGRKVMVVDMFGYSVGSTGLADYADNWTPNDNGYKLMATAWQQAIAYASIELGYISAPSTPTPTPHGPCAPVGGAFPSNLTLRILPLGASIVFGQLSSDNNGFREALRTRLINNGASVNYVGELQNGNMVDNDVSGFEGARIDEITPKMENALPWRPNLILIHAGTNDAIQSYNLNTIGTRYGTMIDRITSALPNTVVLVSTLIPNTLTLNGVVIENNVNYINSIIPGVVQQRAARGALVYLVDMHNGYITSADIADGTHPTDGGYAKMADVWYSAIQQVYAKCWLTAPAAVAGVNDTVPAGIVDTTCPKTPGHVLGPVTVQKGSGIGDGIYVHNGAVPLGQAKLVFPNNGLAYQMQYSFWADINGDGIDDFVYLYQGSQTLGVALNDGTGANGFLKDGGYTQFAVPFPHCENSPFFEDIDGDGRDDYICVANDGTLSAWHNTPGTDPRKPNWVNLGVLFTPPQVTPAQGVTVKLGDIDGDGKVDYMSVSIADGSITAWRNGGVGVPTYWQDLGVVFNDAGGRNWINFQFVDINGDGRSDILWVSNAGEVTTWTNTRGRQVNSLVPFWQFAGVTHPGVGLGVTTFGQVKFGNVAGHKEWVTYQKYEGVGDDYTVFFTGNGGLNPLPAGQTSTQNLVVNLYINQGPGGGTRQPGDGDRYCDMRGKGYDDYIWMAKDGTLTLFGNYQTPPFWLQYGVIYTPADLMVGHTRKDLFLADLDGDGKCDFLIVDKSSGSVHMIRNDYSSATDKFAWTDMGIVFSGGRCPYQYGVGLFDMSIRFADLTGNGYPDYLCIAPDGTTTAWINTAMNFVSLGQAKAPTGADRANIRWVDLNGDGKADYLWVDKFDGSYKVWYNAGPGNPADNGGSYLHWDYQGYAGGGSDMRGECINWSDLNGDGRADPTVVYPQTSEAYVWYNVCPGNGHAPQMVILPPLPGDPFLKTRGLKNTTKIVYSQPGPLPPPRLLIHANAMAESFKGIRG